MINTLLYAILYNWTKLYGRDKICRDFDGSVGLCSNEFKFSKFYMTLYLLSLRHTLHSKLRRDERKTDSDTFIDLLMNKE